MLYIFFILLMTDQLTKLSIIFLSSKMNLTIVHNTGVAFGMLSEKSMLVVFLTVSLLLTLLIFKKTFFVNNALHQKAIIFILAGGAGNLLDRIIYGHVIDFIKLPLIPYFNLADVFINIGMLLYVLGLFKKKYEPRL